MQENKAYKTDAKPKGNGMDLFTPGPMDQFTTISETLDNEEFERLKNGGSILTG